jgi:hypothetical protein
MGAPLGHAGHHRQHRLGPVQRLNLALLIHAQHHRPPGRVVIQPHDVDDLLRKQRAGGKLEGVLQVRLEVGLAPDPPDGRLRQPVRLAIEARDQCVSLPGADSSVATITFSTWSSRIDGGRPGRGSSARPSSRRAMNRARHRSTVDSSTPRPAAACLFVPPSAQRSTIFARSARYWAVFARRAHRASCARSASVKTSSALRRPAGAASSSPASRCAANWRRHFDTDLTATPSACAAAALDIPSAQAKMIRARSARPRPGPLTRRSSSARSSSDSTIGAADGPGITRRLAASKHNHQNFRRDTLVTGIPPGRPGRRPARLPGPASRTLPSPVR